MASTGFEPTTQRLCDADAMFYQLGYQATQLGAGQFVGLMCSRKGMDVYSKHPHIRRWERVLG